MSKLALLATLLVMGATANAQTIYNTKAPFTCHGVSYYPITAFEGGFDCRECHTTTRAALWALKHSFLNLRSSLPRGRSVVCTAS